MQMSNVLEHLLDSFEQQFATTLASLNHADESCSRLFEAMHYVCQAPAKRLRPLLVYATCVDFNVPIEHGHAAAMAVECIHSYSLVHDDLPAMDDDDWRRGKLSCHRAYDEATAILVGDALQALAFELISRKVTNVEAHVQLALIQCLAQAAGARGMVGGQHLDMDYEGKSVCAADIDTMRRMKTGALICAAVRMGGLLAQCSAVQHEHLNKFADYLGLAFQIQDDLLDLQSDKNHLGKATQKDLARQKVSAINPNAVIETQQKRDELVTRALNSLKLLNIENGALATLTRRVIGSS